MISGDKKTITFTCWLILGLVKLVQVYTQIGPNIHIKLKKLKN